MDTTYTAEFFFDGEVLHGRSAVTVHDGIVVAVAPFSGTPEHHVVSPGFIDLQMNGFKSVDISVATESDLLQIDNELLRRGTTSWLGTVVTAPLERLSSCVTSLDATISATDTGCLGLHIEGPFLGRAPGAHNPAWIVPMDSQWCASLPSTVKLITVAPEQVNVIEGIKSLVDRGIVVSLGHTRASNDQFAEAVDAGAQMVTHLFNGMSGVHHRDGGIALFALTNKAITAGLIADLVHVSPDAVHLAFSAKGGSGVCLVSDSVAWESEWATRRGIHIVDGAPRLPDGTLAGSSTPLANCVQHVVQSCGVALIDALRAATRTPATLLGYPQMGCVVVGQRADIVLLDEELSVVEARRGLVSICG